MHFEASVLQHVDERLMNRLALNLKRSLLDQSFSHSVGESYDVLAVTMMLVSVSSRSIDERDQILHVHLDRDVLDRQVVMTDATAPIAASERILPRLEQTSRSAYPASAVAFYLVALQFLLWFFSHVASSV